MSNGATLSGAIIDRRARQDSVDANYLPRIAGKVNYHTAESLRLIEARLAAGFRTSLAGAKAAKVSPVTFQMHESGRRPLTREALDRYSAAFGVSVGYLLTGEDLQPALRVPIVGIIGPGGVVTVANLSGHNSVMTVMAPPQATKSLAAYRVASPGVWPALAQGDLVFFDNAAFAGPLNMPWMNGRECIVQTSDGRRLVRFVTHQKDNLATLIAHDGTAELDVALVSGARVLWIQRRD